MHFVPKAMAFDLDGTLAESKQRVSADMGDLLTELLRHVPVAIMSGGSYEQFEKQLFPSLPEAQLSNLYIFPTNAAACFVYRANGWKPQYDYSYTETQRAEIHQAIEQALAETHVPEPATVYGDRVQDRGAQITFSAVGQNAPVEAKREWALAYDERRKELRRALEAKLPNYSVSTGGITSVDITPKGINKAFGVTRLCELLGLSPQDMLYVGDALEEGGNDSVVIGTGIRTHQVFGPEETAALLRDLLPRFPHVV